VPPDFVWVIALSLGVYYFFMVGTTLVVVHKARKKRGLCVNRYDVIRSLGWFMEYDTPFVEWCARKSADLVSSKVSRKGL